MKTLLIALLSGFPILGHGAEDSPASSWIWELPRERHSFTGLLTDAEFKIVIRELEKRGNDFMSVDFKPHSPSWSVWDWDPVPPRRAVLSHGGNGGSGYSRTVEAAEILNGLRMDRYREHCEALKQGALEGTPSLYPTQIPFLESR